MARMLSHLPAHARAPALRIQLLLQHSACAAAARQPDRRAHLTSGPLNTLGSFMSFHRYRLRVECFQLARLYWSAHHCMALGDRPST